MWTEMSIICSKRLVFSLHVCSDIIYYHLARHRCRRRQRGFLYGIGVLVRARRPQELGFALRMHHPVSWCVDRDLREGFIISSDDRKGSTCRLSNFLLARPKRTSSATWSAKVVKCS